MFQNLSQGATISILYRNEPRVVDGRIISANTHLPQFNPQQPMAMMGGPVTDITVQVGNETIPFVGLPANAIVANFPDKGYFIATDRSSVVREVESMLSASKQILESVPAHQKMVKDCEVLLLELNPDRKKEAEQTKEMNAMRGEIAELKKLLLETLGHPKTE